MIELGRPLLNVTGYFLPFRVAVSERGVEGVVEGVAVFLEGELDWLRALVPDGEILRLGLGASGGEFCVLGGAGVAVGSLGGGAPPEEDCPVVDAGPAAGGLGRRADEEPDAVDVVVVVAWVTGVFRLIDPNCAVSELVLMR